MQLKPRLLAAAFGLALAPLAATAQDIHLLTESPASLEITFSTTVTTQKGDGATRVDTTKAYNSVITHTDVIKAFIADGTIPDPGNTTGAGWRFVAVRAVPGDIYEVNSDFSLYAIKETVSPAARVLIPAAKFQLSASFSTEDTVTLHSTRSIISSRGTVTNLAYLEFIPSFVRKELPPTVTGPFTNSLNGKKYNLSSKTDAAFTLSSFQSTGQSTITFATIPDPVLFFASSGLRYTAKGDFSGTLVNTKTVTRKYTTRDTADEIESVEVFPAEPAGGLVSVRISLGASKLVDATLYSEVAYW